MIPWWGCLACVQFGSPRRPVCSARGELEGVSQAYAITCSPVADTVPCSPTRHQKFCGLLSRFVGVWYSCVQKVVQYSMVGVYGMEENCDGVEYVLKLEYGIFLFSLP